MIRNKSLDGLRGLAALNVVLCHFLFAFTPEVLHKNYINTPENKNPSLLFELITSPFISIFYNGHYAVMVFFVISGYVLTIEYFSPDQQNVSLIFRKRLLARYFRLSIPVAAAVALSYIIYSLDLYHNINLPDAESHPIKKEFSNKNIYFLDAIKEALYGSIIYGKVFFVPVLWTLRIEFIGSIYILLLYIAKPKNYNILFLLLLAIIISTAHQEYAIYLIAVLAGSAVSLIKIQGNFAIIFFAAGFYFGGFQFKSYFYDFLPQEALWGDNPILIKTFYNLIGAFSLVTAIINGFGRSFLQKKSIQFLGDISFSLYLTHFIILCSLSSGIYIFFPKTVGFLVLNFLIYIVDCFLISILFFNYIDIKSIDFSKKISNFFYR